MAGWRPRVNQETRCLVTCRRRRCVAAPEKQGRWMGGGWRGGTMGCSEDRRGAQACGCTMRPAGRGGRQKLVPSSAGARGFQNMNMNSNNFLNARSDDETCRPYYNTHRLFRRHHAEIFTAGPVLCLRSYRDCITASARKFAVAATQPIINAEAREVAAAAALQAVAVVQQRFLLQLILQSRAPRGMRTVAEVEYAGSKARNDTNP